MLAAAAFCPCPPLLHPEVAAGAAPETDGLRVACDRVVAELCEDVDVVVTVGLAPRTGWYPAGARGSLNGYGVDVVLGRGEGPVELPTSLGLAAWLLDRAGWDREVHPFGVLADEAPSRCASLGTGLADRAPRVGMLVMGDGSARRDPKAPGAFDPEAEPFDELVTAALIKVDSAAIAELDVDTAQALMVSGRAPWQLAAAAAAARPAVERAWLRGTRHFQGAPYGVGYAVVGWHEHE